MNDIEELPVEALGGERPASAAGDRLMVGLAALVMVAGLLIAGANLLGAMDGEAAADASTEPTPQASRTPRPSPTPRPLQELTLVPDALPTPPLSGASEDGWIEAIGEIPVLSNPIAGAQELARLMPGDVTMAVRDWAMQGDDGWVQTIGPTDAAGNQIFGWVQLRSADGTALGIFYPMTSSVQSAEVWSLRADPGQFTAMIVPPARRGVAMAEPMVAVSTDGEEWRARAANPQLVQGGWSAVRGPTGWLAVSTVDGGPGQRPWFWESADGLAWDPIGYLPTDNSSYFPQLVGSERGYLLVLGDGGSSTRLWYSPNGITWLEGVDPFATAGRDMRFLGSDPYTLLALDSGFLAWTGSYDGAPYGAQVAFSPDGRSWSLVAVDEAEVGQLQLAEIRGGVIAIATLSGGSIGAWRSVTVDGRITRLERAASLERGLDGSTVEALFSNGEHAWALGYDLAGLPRLSRTDGAAWEVQPLPAGLRAGARLMGAARQQDLVVVGARPTGAGDNPIFWHLRASGEWVAEPDPVVPIVADPSPEDCGPVPTSAIRFSVLEPAIAVACHGDTSMTFVAWSLACDWCKPTSGSITGTAWLTDDARSLLLSPIQGNDVWWRDGVLDPNLDRDDSWNDAWVQVTGHYADAASESCGWDISSGEAGYYYAAGRQAVEFCRQRFVITEVTVVDGPPSAAQ